MIRKRLVINVFYPLAANVDDACEYCGFPGLADCGEHEHVYMLDDSDDIFCSRRCAEDAIDAKAYGLQPPAPRSWAL